MTTRLKGMSRYPLATARLCVLLLFGLSFYFCWDTLQGLVESSQQEQQRDLLRLLTSDLEEIESKALARAELVAAMPGIAAAVERQDSLTLQRLAGPLFEVQRKKYGVAQGNFCSVKNRALMRLQSPGAELDDVSSYRHLVVHTNQTGEVHSGVEVARSGPQIFGEVPVLSPTGRVGTFGIGMSFESQIERMHAHHGIEVAALFERKLLEQVATQQEWDTSPQNQLGQYLQVASSDWQLIRELLAGQRLDYLREPLNYVASNGPQPYLVCVVPLPDLTGRFVGQWVGVKRLPPFRTQIRNGMVRAGVACLLGMLLSWAALQVIIRGMLLAPLSELTTRLAQWSLGEKPPPVHDLLEQAPALTPLLQACERLGQSSEEA